LSLARHEAKRNAGSAYVESTVPEGTVEVLSSRSCRTHTSPIEYIASSARRIERGPFPPKCSPASGRSWRELLAQTELCPSRSAALTIMLTSCSLFLPLCLSRRRCSSSKRDRRNGAIEISARDRSSGRQGIPRRVSALRWSRRRKHTFEINESIIEGSDLRRSGECSWRETGSPPRESESIALRRWRLRERPALLCAACRAYHDRRFARAALDRRPNLRSQYKRPGLRICTRTVLAASLNASLQSANVVGTAKVVRPLDEGRMFFEN
jgi:hypothetical protein